MAFDPSTARLLDDSKPSGKFDPSTATLMPEAPKPEGGLIASLASTAGQLVKGAGQAAADYLPGVTQDNALKSYGQEVIDANPTAVRSLSDVAASPWTATKEAVGNAVGSMGAMVGAQALGRGVEAVAPFTGPARPIVSLLGKGIQFAGPVATAALPSYGGIREQQIQDDPTRADSPEAKARALAGAGAVGLIERSFGPEKLALSAMTKEGRAKVIESMAGKSLAGSIGKGMAKGAAVEGAEELVQNPVEQFAAYQDPTTPENLQETAFGGVMGALGGGVLGGAGGGISYAARPEQPQVDPNAGPLSRAAATAQETGAAGLAQAAQQAQAAEGDTQAAQPDADPLAGLSARLTPEAMRAVRTAEGYGPESVNEVLRAYQIARNPELDATVRQQATEALNGFWQGFDAQRAAEQQRILSPKPDVPPAGSFGQMNEFADLLAQERADLEQRRNPPPFEEMKGVDAGFDPMSRARNQVPPASGSFGAMNEFADLLGQEQADVQQRREGIAQTQGMQRDSRLESIGNEIDANRQQQTADARRSLLDQLDADPETVNLLPRFESMLKKQGYAQRRATPEERELIARRMDARAALVNADQEPVAPNELDAAAMGIRERQPKVRQPQPAPAEKPARAAFPMTQTGAQRQAAERTQATGQAFEVVPHPTVKGRFAVQAVEPASDSAESALRARTGQPSGETQEVDGGRTRLAQAERQQGMGLPARETLAESPLDAPAQEFDIASLDTSRLNDSAPVAAANTSPERVAQTPEIEHEQPTNALLNSGEIGTPAKSRQAELRAKMEADQATSAEIDEYISLVDQEFAVRRLGGKAQADQWFETPERARSFLTESGYQERNGAFEKDGEQRVRIAPQSTGRGGVALELDEFAPDVEDGIAEAAKLAGRTEKETRSIYRNMVEKNGKEYADDLLRKTVEKFRTQGTANEKAPQALAPTQERGTAQQAEVTPTAQEFEHNGTRIYPMTVNVGGERKSMWGAESADNRAKRLAGERFGFGDSLHETPEQARAAADRERKDVEGRAEYARQSEEARAQREADAAARKADTANGFLEGKAPLVAGKARQSLDKQYRFDGDVRSVREQVEWLHANGKLEVSTFEESKIKPMTRTQFNRASQREQDAHEKKMREAGNKTVYLVGGSDLGKTAYDYAQHLLSRKASAPEPTQTLPQAGQASRPQGAQEGAQESGQGVEELRRQLRAVEDEIMRAAPSKFGNGQLGGDIEGAMRSLKVPKALKEQRKTLKEQVRAAQRPRSDLDTIAERVTEPTHADPGEAPEAATAPVIAASLKKSAQNTPLDVKQAKATLLADIDRAIENVPPANHDMAADLAQEKARKFKVSERVAKLAKGSMRDKLEREEGAAFEAMQADRIAKTAQMIGFVTLDVPGDGKFKVVNTVENLQAFRDKVKASPGFREDPTTGMKLDPRPAGPTKKEQSDAITKAVKEGRRSEALDDLGNAIEIARLHGANDDPLLERFREIADKDYDAWRAEQEAEGEIAAREAGQSATPNSPEPRAEQGQQADMEADTATAEESSGVAADDASKGRAKAKPKLEDFGEKLEGAKKFMRQQHLDALSDDALDIATEPLSKTFPVPNYAKLADEGVPSDSLAFIAVARNAIPAKPRVGYKLKRWVEQVKQLRSLAHTVLSGEVTFDKMQATAEESSAYANVRGLFYTATAIKDIQPDLLPQAAKWRIEAHGGYSIYRDLKVSPGQTVYSLENPKGRDAGVYGTDAADVTERAAETIRAAVEAESDKPAERRLTKLAVYSDRYTKDIFIGFKGLNDVVRLKTGFANATDARSYIAENQDALQATIDEMRAGPQDRRPGNRPRQGPPHREGDATPEMFASMFSFRGVQFGSYVEGDRRQAELNEAYDALMDLADVLAIPPKALSLNGSLGLAFGARGSGNAKAHFEPGNVVINLTKTKGAGSLAHEWLHALDNYLDRQSDGSGKSTGFLSNRNAAGAVRAELFSAWKAVQKAFKRGGFLERAQKYDAARSKPYWSTDIEMAARSFERYILDRIEQRGGENDYLVNVYKEGGAYPTDAEMVEQGITAAYDKLFETIDTRETDKGVALFSRDTASTGTTPDAIWSAVESLVGPLRRRRIVVVQSADVLVEQGILQSRDANGAQAFVKDGKAYFIASNIQPGNERAVFLHEVGAHLGMEKILSPLQRSVLLNRIKTWAAQANGSVESRIAQAAQRRVEAAGVTGTDADAELIAYAVEEAVKAGINPTTDTTGPIGQWFKTLWSALRTALEKLGLVNASKLTAQDVVNLAHGAANVAMSEDATGGDVQLSRADQIDSPAFRKWFGNSRVVDEGGRPLVVYHGTQRDFDAFDGPRLYFTPDADYASGYADDEGGNVVPAYLSIQNPLDLSAVGADTSISPQTFVRMLGAKRITDPALREHIAATFSKDLPVWGFMQDARVNAAIRAAGYDGVIQREANGNGRAKAYIAFRPEQVKSATGNSGAFSPSDPRIQFSRAAAIPNAEAVSSKARDFLADVVKRPGSFGIFARSLNTQLHKATQNKQFKAVWTRANAMFMDAARAMSRPADLAPDLLPKFDVANMGDAARAAFFGKGKVADADMKAVADILSFGTLYDGADPTKGMRFTAKHLREGVRRQDGSYTKLTDEQIKLYEQARAAIDASLDESAAAEAWKLVRKYAGADVRDFIAQNPRDAQGAIADAIAQTIEQTKEQIENLHARIEALQDMAADEQEIKATERDIKQLERTVEDLQDIEERVSAIFAKSKTLQQAGYMPLMRFGEFRIAVTSQDEKGETVAYVSRYESAFEANRARRQLMQAFPAADGFTVGAVERTNPDKWKQFKGVSPETIMLFAKESGIKADDVMQEWYKEAVSSRSSLRRMVHRKGYQGFSDDLPRVLASFITSNGKAAGYAYHLADMQQMLQDKTMPEDVQREAQELIEAITEPTDKGAKMRGFMAGWYLLGSIASATINATQTLTQSLPFLSMFGKKGFAPGEAAKHLAGAYKQLLGTVKDADLRDALKRAEEAGTVDSNEVFHLYSEAMKPMLAKLGSGNVAYRARAFMALWGAPFAIVEKMNRKATFIAAWNMAKAQGKSSADAYAFGERAVQETQGIYAVHNRPNWGRTTVGGAALVFKQFAISYLELTVRMWQAGPEGKAAATMMLSILFLTAGLSGLPGEDDLLDLIDTFSQTFLGKNTVSKMELRHWLQDNLGKELGSFVNSGVSAFMPFDVSGRFGMGNLLPGTAMFKPSEPNPTKEALEVFGVPGSFALSAIDGIKAAMDGNLTALGKGFAPKAVADWVKAGEMAASGEARDMRGNKITDVGLDDAFWQAVGFNPTVKASAGKRAGEINEWMNYNKRKESEIVADMARAVLDRDQDGIAEAQQALRDWNSENPEAPIVVHPRQVQQRIRSLQTERSGRIVKMAPPELRRRVEEALEE